MLGIGFEQADELDAPLERAAAPRPSSRRRTLLLALIGGAALWTLVAWVIVPAAVPDAPPRWEQVARDALLGWVALAALVWAMTSRTFTRRIVGRATPGSLGAVRAIICVALLGASLGERAADVAEI